MAYIPEINSVVAFQSDPTKLLSHASVSGAVSISNLPTTQNVSGSVVAFPQGTIITSIVSTVPSSVLMGASIFGTAPVTQTTIPWVITGSVQGAGAGTQYSEDAVVAAATGTGVMFKKDVSASTIAIVSPLNPLPVSVQGTVNIGAASGSVIAFQGGTQITSLVSTVPSSVIVGASIFGLAPVNVTNFPTTQNVSGSVATFQGTTEWAVKSSIAGGIFPVSGSVAAVVTNNVTVVSSIAGGIFPVSGSVAATITNTNLNVSGSVVGFQGTNPWVIQSIVGTYAEDAAHTSADKGLFTLGVRNDAVASFAGANLEYTPFGVDSAGRNVIKPFAPEESRVEGYISLTSTSITALIAAGGAGIRNYITDAWFANTGSVSTLITFQDGAGSILGYTIAPAGGGSNLPGLVMPIRTGANATFDIQAGTATSTLYGTVKGFKAP